MVLSERWRVTDDALAQHISALEAGQKPEPMAAVVAASEKAEKLKLDLTTFLAGSNPAVDPEETLAPNDSQSPLRKSSSAVGAGEGIGSPQSARQKHCCPQLGQALKSPRSPSSILQSTALSTLTRPCLRDDGSKWSERNPAKSAACTPRLDLLLKQDTIACIQDGKRFGGAPCDMIRVYVKMPSVEGHISMWVSPDMYVHPLDLRQEGAIRGVTQTIPLQASDSLREGRWSSSPHTSIWCHKVCDDSSLQEVIEQCTGMPVNQQVLRTGTSRLDLNSDIHVPRGSTLRQCGIGHGVQILMNGANLAVHKFLVEHSHENRTGAAWCCPRWQYSHKPKIFGTAPQGGYLSTQSPVYHDYTVLPDASPTPCAEIRKSFGSRGR